MADAAPANSQTASERFAPKPPKQIQDQIAEADALRAELDKQQSSPPQQPEGGGDDAQQQPAPVEAEPPQPSPSRASTGAEDDQTWEQRYRSLHGRFETTQRNYTQQGERLSQLENLIATLKVKGAEEPAPPDPNAPPPPVPKYVTDQQRTDYGDEFLDVVGNRARELVAPEFEQLGARLKRLEGRLDATGEIISRTQVKDVYGQLAAEVPDWKEINRHDAFKMWLSQPDPYSGQVRANMLREAFDRHEAGRVVAFFRGFLTEAAGLPSNESSPGFSAPQPAPNGNGSGKPSLEEFAAPGRARSAPQELPPDKPIYTSASIAKFMADKRMGKYRGREADAEAIEQDIFRAQHEGRIQG